MASGDCSSNPTCECMTTACTGDLLGLACELSVPSGDCLVAMLDDFDANGCGPTCTPTGPFPLVLPQMNVVCSHAACKALKADLETLSPGLCASCAN